METKLKINGNIAFQEEGHKYFNLNDPTIKYISVTTLIEKYGKEFDKEFLEKQNKYLLFVNGFDWTSGKIRDEDGNIINYPPLIELSRMILPV